METKEKLSKTLMKRIRLFEGFMNKYYEEVDSDRWEELSEWGDPKELLVFDKRELRYIEDLYAKMSYSDKIWKLPVWLHISHQKEPFFVTIDGVRFDANKKFRETEIIEKIPVPNYSIEIILPEMEIGIFKAEDEYYHVSYSYNNEHTEERFFVCDQLAGIRKLFEDFGLVK